MPITFEKWLAAIDRILTNAIGLSHSDLVDRCWRDMFDDGISPNEATADIIADPWSHI